jgi:hypothetical protein
MMLTWRAFIGMVCARESGQTGHCDQVIEREGVVMPGKGGNTRAGRPVKGTSDKKRREKVQRQRLIGLGVSEDKVKKLNPAEVRQLLKRPAKLKK